MGEYFFSMVIMATASIMFVLSITNCGSYIKNPNGKDITLAIIYMFSGIVQIYSLFAWVPAS